MLEQTIKYNEPLNISTKDGNAIVISEEDYNALVETLNISSIPHLKEEIFEGVNTPASQGVAASEVQW